MNQKEGDEGARLQRLIDIDLPVGIQVLTDHQMDTCQPSRQFLNQGTLLLP